MRLSFRKVIAAAGLSAGTWTLSLLAVAALATVARAEQPVTAFTLDNGMDVVVIEDHRAPVVTHMVWYRVGGGGRTARCFRNCTFS